MTRGDAAISSNGVQYRLYISLHIFWMFCVGCRKLPGLIQCSVCHRQQGAGPLLCMTDWNEAAELRCGQNTPLNTALPQLHTPHSRLLPHSHFSSRSDAAQGLARCLHWSSVGEELREAWMPETDFYLERGSFLSCDSLFQSRHRRSLQL